MFRGWFEHTMDNKGRVSIPARFRDQLVENNSETLIVTHFNQCLVSYSLEEWEHLERKIAALPQMKPEVQLFQRYFLSGASECSLDKQGRILIPSFLREHAGIDKDVIFVGMLKKIELWSKTRWNKAFDESQDRFHEISSSLADLGI